LDGSCWKALTSFSLTCLWQILKNWMCGIMGCLFQFCTVTTTSLSCLNAYFSF
jgi:hypothetical protein